MIRRARLGPRRCLVSSPMRKVKWQIYQEKGQKMSQLAGLNDGPLYHAVKNYKYRMIPLHQAGDLSMQI